MGELLQDAGEGVKFYKALYMVYKRMVSIQTNHFSQWEWGMPDNDFFQEQQEHSKIKSEIVSEYFSLWAETMLRKADKQRTGGKIAYIDLYAGTGKYEDSSLSTPLLIMNKVLNDERLSRNIVLLFNDINGETIDKLEQEIESLDGIDRLFYKPIFNNDEVGDEVVKFFEEKSLVPALFFLDPWGYKGLSLRLLNAALKNWGCDCIFFFNYKLINRHIANKQFLERVKLLFGQGRAVNLFERLPSLSPAQRETLILEEFGNALTDMNYHLPLWYRFKNKRGNRTTHYLMFVCKHPLGYQFMENVMKKYSSAEFDGVPSFEFNPRHKRLRPFFTFSKYSITYLQNRLLEKYSGRRTTVGDIYENRQLGLPYVKENYKEALRRLETDHKVIVDKPPNQRIRGGKVTLGDDRRVYFPPE